jgi:hypothetical protein
VLERCTVPGRRSSAPERCCATPTSGPTPPSAHG